MGSWIVLRVVGPLLLASGAVLWVDRMSDLRRLQPPALVPGSVTSWRWRRALVLGVLTFTLYLGVFQSLGFVGLDLPASFEALPLWQLFWLHGVFVLCLGVWYLLGFAGAPGLTAGGLARQWRSQLGLRASSVLRDLALGTVLGVVGWAVILIVLLGLAGAITAWGSEAWLPRSPSPMVVWIAALPSFVRVLVSLSAGLVEEVFFRGFLQPRIGVLGSTLLFALAHLSYEQPIMLVGIVLLSLGFAWLCLWRGSVWAAIAAHATFDGIQLLVIIPLVLSQTTPSDVLMAVVGKPPFIC